MTLAGLFAALAALCFAVTATYRCRYAIAEGLANLGPLSCFGLLCALIAGGLLIF